MPEALVAALIAKDGKVLAERRKASEDFAPGAIWLPGGHVEPGEDEFQAMRREAREEFGVEILDMKKSCTLPWHFEGKDYLVHYFTILKWTGEIKNNEAGELLWLSRGKWTVFSEEVDRKAIEFSWELISEKQKANVECVKAVICDGEKFLAEKRKADDPLGGGKTALVGGHIEEGETAEQALVRELGEEMAITPTEFEFLCAVPYTSRSKGTRYLYHCFLVKKWNGSISKSSEAENLRWIGFRETDQLDYEIEGWIVKEIALPRFRKTI